MPVQDIYSNALQRVRSPQEVEQGFAQNALAQSQLRNSDMAFQTQQDQLARDAAQRRAIAGSNGDPAAIRAALVASGDAAGLEKHDAAQSLSAKNAAAATESKALAGKHTLETRALGVSQLAQGMRGIDPNNDGQIVNLYKQAVDSGLLTREDAMQEINSIPPAGSPERAQWHQTQVQKGMTLVQQMEQQLGQAKLKEEARGHDLTAKTQLQVAGIHEGGQNARNAATIAKDYKVAGIDPQTGNFVGGEPGGQSLVDLVGAGKIAIATALARTPPGQKERFAAELQSKYPDFDPTALATKTAAAKAFTTGKEGGLLRSIGTANKHLDMLGGLVDALDNNDTQLLNKAKNYWKEQTGQEAPTNFDAAREIVGQEVVKSIVINGGSMTERKDAAEAINKAKSPAQLRGVIKTYKTIMAAQQESLLQQRDAAGLPRSTMPDYTEAKPAAPVAGAFSDPGKEARYQAWKAKQGK